MKVAVYSRKSIYTGKGESIENQIEMCKQYIFTNIDGVSESDIAVFEDEGFSAKNTDRPQFQKLLREIRRKKFKYVVCYRLDRISRSVGDFAVLLEELKALDVDFISIKEKFDLTPMGKAMMMIASVFAQLERETLAERVRDNMFMLARTGRWLGGAPPTGFISETVENADLNGRTKTACKLKHDPDQIKTVRMIFKIFSETHSVSRVYKRLIDAGVKSKTGKYFSKTGIKQILENPVYCIADKDARDYFVSHGSDVCFSESDCSDELGLLSYNKRDYRQKNAPRQEKSEWIIAKGKHKGIITGNQWAEIQNILEANKPSSPIKKMNNGYALLSGLIICKCGKRMFARLRKAKGADGLYDYICDAKLQGGTKNCGGQNLNGPQTDIMVYNYLMQYADENPHIHTLLEKLRKDLKSQEASNPQTEINARIKKCGDDINSLVNKLTQPDISQALLLQINTKVSELAAELERLNSEKKRLQTDPGFPTGKLSQSDALSSTLSNLNTCYKELDVQEKRTLIKMLVQKMEWDGQDLHIYIYCE